MEENRKKERGALLYAVLGVAVLIAAVAGSTFAYFQASATTTGTPIQGETLQINLGITANRVSKGTGKLIPIYDGSVSGHTSQLQTAANTENDCVDSKGYTVCHIYEITITNTNGDATTVDTTLNLTGSTNIKWANMSNRTTVGATHTTADTTIATSTALAQNGTVKQYIMVYINNTGTNQSTADSGKQFSGTVTVTASTGDQVEATF